MNADATSERSGSTAIKSTALVITAILFTAATLRSPITGVGALMNEIQGETGLSHTLAGLLTTLPLLAFSLFSLAAPGVSRKLGVEKTLLYCLLIMSVGIIVRSTPSVWMLFVGTALIGVAIALCNVLLPGLIKRDFPLKVGILTGIYTSSMNLWGAVSSGLSPSLADQAWGWRGALGVWVILAVGAAILWIPIAYSRKRTTSTTPESVKSTHVWKSPLAWQITLFMGLQSLMFYVGIAWLPEILYERGISYNTSGWLLSYLQFASMFGSFTMPVIAGRFRSQTGLAILSASFFVIGYGGILLGSAALVPLFMILLGLGCGTSFGLVILFFSLRAHTSEQAAGISGMAQCIGYLLAAVGPILFGFLHDVTGTWTIPLIILVVLAFVTVLSGMLAGRQRYI